jgi:hypothetical protein
MNLPDAPIAHEGFFATVRFSRRTTDSNCGHLITDQRAGVRILSDLATAPPLPLS